MILKLIGVFNSESELTRRRSYPFIDKSIIGKCQCN